MNETSEVRARRMFKEAFKEKTPDWPDWFMGLSFDLIKSADAVATFVRKSGGHINIPVMIWHTNRAKAHYYRSLTALQAKQNRIGLVIPKDSSPRFIRQRFFERLANARKQFNCIRA